VTTTSPVAVQPPRSTGAAILVSLRPRQWSKNLLVFAAAGAGGVLAHPATLARAGLAFVALCLAASGTYLVNDVADAERDRSHPTKRGRPIAAGELGRRTACLLGAGLMALGVAVATVTRWQLGIVVVAYLALTLAYSAWLKQVPVVDIVVVSAGFVLRAIAGGAAVDVRISNWFFIVASFGSLFVVSGKRTAESVMVGSDPGTTRPTLAGYTPSFLAYLRSLTSAVVLVSYCLWAFEKAAIVDPSVPWYQLSIVPFAGAVLRYAQLIDAGEGGAPEDLFLRDRPLVALVLVWVVIFGLGIYIT